MKSFIKMGFFVFIVSIVGCKKLIQVDPPVTATTGASIYAADESAISVLTGIYVKFSSSAVTSGGIGSMSFFPALSADELSLFGTSNATLTAYYENGLTNSNTGGGNLWTAVYPTIYVLNSAIQGIKTNTGLTPAVKQQLLGEAFFDRAFCYFYLVNFYGDVPLVISTDFSTNNLLARTSSKEVYQQIISDLKNAQSLLSASYLDASLLQPTTERVRPTSWAATALLARTYLYTAAWDSAEAQASEVIANSSLFNLTSLDSVFLMNSLEAIWQLQPVLAGRNTLDAATFILPAGGPNSRNNPAYLSSFLLNAFDSGDNRKLHWVDSVIVGTPAKIYYYPYKYKVNINPSPVTEYTMVLRLAEQYLIRAEARAQHGKTSDAIADLNAIRYRAGLPDYAGATDKASLLSAILHERQTELFTEWGNRWLDLKRTGTVDAVMGTGGACAAKGGAWSPNWQLYPVPLSELQKDPFLTQNNGY
jgi:hypothetical protein